MSDDLEEARVAAERRYGRPDSDYEDRVENTALRSGFVDGVAWEKKQVEWLIRSLREDNAKLREAIERKDLALGEAVSLLAEKAADEIGDIEDRTISDRPRLPLQYFDCPMCSFATPNRDHAIQHERQSMHRMTSLHT